MNHIGHNKWHMRGGRLPVALGLAVLLTGCDSLLEVSLPGTIVPDELASPAFAELLTQSAVGTVECSYSRFMNKAAGMEDVWLRHSSGVSVNYAHIVQGTSECGSTLSDNRYSWWDPMQEARFTAEDTYARLTGWTDEELLPGRANFDGREHMLGINALYASIPYTMFGEHVCEITIELGELLSPDSVLGIAEGWVNTALGHIATHIAEFQLVDDPDTGAPGTDANARLMPFDITDDVEMMAYALRARIRWARGDLVNAAADAALVTDGFFAYATRNSGLEPHRANSVYELHHSDSGLGLDAFIAYPNGWWVDNSVPGTYPAPVGGWPAIIPFTGYLDLAIDPANGRAVDPVGNPVTLTTDPGATLDSRVEHAIGELSNGDDAAIQEKYTSGDQPIIMVNWMEMRLIEAEANTANAVAMVNRLRADEGLPAVSYAPNADEIENMIFEERRRALWLEGRFWSTKIMNQKAVGTKLWFPRELGDQEGPEDDSDLQGGVRLRMQTAEFDINPNLTRNQRATGCGPYQRPVSPEQGDIAL